MNEKNENVDFIVIGAQKSGSTSLFKYLVAHPAVFMPSEKEVMFFQNDTKYEKGQQWYWEQYFALADENKIKGEATTHYMMYRCVPERIHDFYPDIKLVALLRNPIDRAYSHYRMGVRREAENRTFEQCIVEDQKKIDIPDSQIDHNTEYLYFGQYGRILENYLKYFDKSKILIIFSEDLQEKPNHVVKELYNFLSLDEDFVPANLGKKYHVSGDQRFPGLNDWVMAKARMLRKKRWFNRYFWRINLDAIIFWVATEFNVKPQKVQGPSEKTRSMLVDFYADDVRRLESFFNIKVPWSDFKNKS